MKKVKNYKPSEVHSLLHRLIESNSKIIEQGGIPISVSLVGEAGIGKTTICREVAKDLERDFFKLNLSQLTEPAELIGYYVKEHKIVRNNKEEWVTENLLEILKTEGAEITSEVRTRPCPPSWVENLKEGGILLLDDYSRSNTLFSQAIMELINENEMIGWDLKKKKIQNLLSENPDDGEYNVSSYDKAQSDRLMRINTIWDANDWASRAEKLKMDERLINFVLSNPEFFENKKKDGISNSASVSPRMMDKFFNLVATIDNFDKNLDQISDYGAISVGETMTNHLITFVNKGLDRLPSVSKLLLEDELKDAKAKLTSVCGNYEESPETFKGATAAILATRIFNYVNHHHKDIKKDKIKQLCELMLHTSFTPDQKFLIVQRVMKCGNNYAALVAGDPRFMKYIKK